MKGKGLGKQRIVYEALLDGVSQGSSTITRNVYRRSDGSFWVSWLGRPKRIEQLPDGSFYWRANRMTVKALTIDDVVKGLKDKIASG